MEIQKQHLQEYLARTKMSVPRLSEILNVNPVTVRRWLSGESPPTSTAFLILLPLLLAEGINVIPEPDLAAWNAYINGLKRIPGFNVDPTRIGEFKRRFANGACTEYNSALRLFLKLAQAWKKIDPDSVEESMKQEPDRNADVG